MPAAKTAGREEGSEKNPRGPGQWQTYRTGSGTVQGSCRQATALDARREWQQKATAVWEPALGSDRGWHGGVNCGVAQLAASVRRRLMYSCIYAASICTASTILHQSPQAARFCHCPPGGHRSERQQEAAEQDTLRTALFSTVVAFPSSAQ